MAVELICLWSKMAVTWKATRSIIFEENLKILREMGNLALNKNKNKLEETGIEWLNLREFELIRSVIRKQSNIGFITVHELNESCIELGRKELIW